MSRTLTLRPPVPAVPQDRSYWVKRSLPDGADRTEALCGTADADVVIVGGGLTGLWSAWRILERSPGMHIVVLEADYCGSGASGRNGGQVHSWFNHLSALCAIVGVDEGFRLAKASVAAIEEMDQLETSGVLDMGLRRDGWIWGASSTAQEGSWQEALHLAASQGEQPFTLLDADRMAELTGTRSAHVGVLERGSGSMDSFRLVRSLRRNLIGRGVTVHEGTAALHIAGGSHPVVRTAHGQLRARKVLIASNVWAGSIPELNRYMFSVDAQVVATQAAPELLDDIGLTGGQSMADGQTKVVYWHRTIDGRLLMGRGSGIPIYRDRVGARSNRNPRLVPDVVRELHRIYPELAGVEITHDWVGSVDISASRVPLVGHLTGEPNLVYCVGWSGTALAQIPVVARVLAGLLVPAHADEWTGSRLVDTANRGRIVPEPLRFAGAWMVKGAVDRMTRRELRDRPVDPITRAAVGLVPKHRTYRPHGAE